MAVDHVPVGTNEQLRESRLFGSMWATCGATGWRSSASTPATSRSGVRLAGLSCWCRASLAWSPFLWDWLAQRPPGGHLQSIVLGGVLLMAAVQAFALGVIADLISAHRTVSQRTSSGYAASSWSSASSLALPPRPGRCPPVRYTGLADLCPHAVVRNGRRAPVGGGGGEEGAVGDLLLEAGQLRRDPRIGARRSRSVSVTSLHIQATLCRLAAPARPDRARRGRARWTPTARDAGAGQVAEVRHRHLGSLGASGERWTACARSRHAGGAARSPSALLTTTRSASSMIPRLMPCSSSPPAGEDEQEEVDQVGDRDLGLADADGLDDDDVEPGGLAQQHRLAGAAGDAAERPPRRRRSDEGVRVAAELGHAGLVAEDRAAAAGSDGSTASTATRWPCVDEVEPERLDERRLARRPAGPDAHPDGVAPVCGASRRRALDRALAVVVGAGRLDERDRPRQRSRSPSRPADRGRLGRHRQPSVALADEGRGPAAAASGMLRAGPEHGTTPASRRASWSCGGITPPHTTRMSSPPGLAARRSAGHERLVAGRPGWTRRRRARRSRRVRATSSGVWNSGPKSTSKPRSAKAVAITLAPRSWPSWPILATRMRGRRPSASAKAVDLGLDRWKSSSPS